jgi:DNA modification methylase
MLEIDKIYEGHTLDVMKTLPDKSVNMICTSPPYWGLRDYGIEGIIWDGDPECPHNFNSVRTARPNGSGGKTDFIKNTHARKAKDNISEYVDIANKRVADAIYARDSQPELQLAGG